jgi:hypothetical protein
VRLYDRPDDSGRHDRLDVILQLEHQAEWYRFFANAGRAN